MNAYQPITVGEFHACGLRSDGTTACWGHNRDVPEGLSREFRERYILPPPFPPEDERFTAITAGWGNTCGQRPDGSVTCWDRHGHFMLFGTEQVTGITVGRFDTCGLRSDGRAICAVTDGSSLLGNENLVSISLGFLHLCGVHTDGRVICWGSDFADQLSPPEEGPFTEVSAGRFHTCALDRDGAAVCWGWDLERASEVNGVPKRAEDADNGMGALEWMFTAPRTDPPEGVKFTAISAGMFHACGLRALRQDGSAVCWGYDFKQVREAYYGGKPEEDQGPGPFSSDESKWLLTTPPTAPPRGGKFTAITAGALHTCGLKKDGGVSCWGPQGTGLASLRLRRPLTLPLHAPPSRPNAKMTPPCQP